MTVAFSAISMCR